LVYLAAIVRGHPLRSGLAAVVIRFDARYECAGTVAIRVPVLPVSSLPGGGAGTATPAGELAAGQRFRDALEMSSPDLARALRAAADRPPAAGRKLGRLAGSLTAYRLRMAYRPTPFGLLAGVALGSFGRPAEGRLGASHLAGLRPDAGWLAEVVHDIVRDASVRLGPVRVTAGAHMYRGRDAFVVRRPGAAAEVRVRATPLIELVIDTVADGADLGELTSCLAAAAPRIPADRFGVLLRTLISHGVLDTDLLPPPGAADPLGHVLARLPPPGHDDAGPAAGLAAIRDRMRPVRASGTAAALAELRARMRAIRTAEPLVHADLALDAGVRLPPEVAREAELAAEIGWRCASDRGPGDQLSRRYHRAFVARYGYGQLVPLPHVAGEIADQSEPAPAARDDDRDPVLMELAMLAGAARRREVTLDENLINRLSRRASPGDAGLAPESVELHAELISRSLADLEAGRFLLAVSPQGGARQAGASLGRFAYLLPAAARNCAVPDSAARDPLTARAEVVFRPRDPRLGNLMAHTGWASHRIPVGFDGSQPGDLPVRDLAVCADEHRLWLFSYALDQFVEPVCYTMLRPDVAPPAARFLLALASARNAAWRPWRWGSALRLPYRPRVRVGQVILSPASWNIPPELDAAARRDDLSGWREAVAAWRAASGVPGWLLCGQDDQRLPLCLDDPVHVGLLRRICRRAPGGAVSELSGGLDEPATQSWLTSADGPHIAEIVFPLFRRADRKASAPPVPPRTRYQRPRPEMPGGHWLYAKVFTPPARQDEVLSWLHADLLPAAEDAGVDRWFFIRYQDSGEPGGHHLRIRFHGDPARLRDRLLPALHDWTSALSSAGLCRRITLDTYEPETGEYGGPSMVTAAERAFAADSRWVIDLLATAPGRPEAPEQLAAASLARLAVTLGPWRDRPPAPRLTPGRLPPARLTPARRAMVRTLTEGTAALLRSLPPEPWVATMRGYAQRLSESLPAEDSARIAARLLHLHENRLLGGGFADKDVVLALARAAVRGSRACAPARTGAASSGC
jgi:thiopeptide-type bacteriocin biosynthesis protein